jgi:hypothetical protein
VPKLLFINENAVLIQCEYVPMYSNDEQAQLTQAAVVAGNICRPKCGYWRDAALKNETARNKSNGQREFKLICLHPTSPYLPETIKKLRETGNI